MHLPDAQKASLEATARTLVAHDKGILAADESTATIGKRFQSIGVENNEATRRDYRHLLFSARDLGKSVSGVILYDETLRQKGSDGAPLTGVLAKQGILPGIKVDTGAKPLAGHAGESVTEGLDGLRERLGEYRRLGAAFTKWRAVLKIGAAIPSPACLHANAHALARYAALAQEAGLVPIVEPEVLMEGDHGVDRCQEVTGQAWHALFSELAGMGVYLPGILLKPSMVIAGAAGPERTPPQEVAHRTVHLLRGHVPPAVPGIVFLSGGQSPEEATQHLRLMNALGPHPWRLSFSYGRALQEPALKAWAGKAQNVGAAQAALVRMADANRAACSGKGVAQIVG
ncbi:MAG: class I fructose-bisphosphate aldolase [Thermoplasmatota archaeon]